MNKIAPARRDLRTPSGANSAIEGNISIERAKDGLSAVLTFTTAFAASCKVAFFQDTETPPPVTTLTWSACTSPQPGRSFQETVRDLNPELLYSFSVKVWAQGQSEDSAAIKTVRENAAPGDSSIRYLLRVDVPTRSTQIDSFTSSAGLDAIQKEETTPFACKPLDNSRGLLGTRSSGLAVKRVTSRGFLSGISTTNEDLADGLVLLGTSIQTNADEWTLNVQGKDSSGSIRVISPPQFKSISVSQTGTTATIDQLALDDSEVARAKIQQNDALGLTWSTATPAENAIVIVILTSPTSDTGVICGFDAKSGAATIPPEQLAKIKGKAILMVRVESYQIPKADRWFARITDWRSLQISIQ